jgi:AcrR family transcriptional regulator
MALDERPLRKDAARNRRRILDGAQALFAERGLGATLNDVAHRADVGVGTVYRHFPDKELLIDALFEQRIDTLAAIAQQGLDQPDPWIGLVLFFERSFAEQAVDRGLKELLLGASRGGERVARARAKLTPLIDQLIARAKASGALRQDVEGPDMLILWLMIGASVDFTEHVAAGTWRRYLKLMLTGLRRSDDQPAPLEPPALDDKTLQRAMQTWTPRGPVPARRDTQR